MTTLATVQPQGDPRPLFKNSNFLILWLGQLVSHIGDGLFNFAMIIWILQTSGAPALAAIMMVSSIPGLVLGPIAGTFVDRLDRKMMIWASDFIRGGLMLAAAWLMASGSFNLAHIYIILMLFGIIRGFFTPALSASLPNMIRPEDLSRANSIQQATSSGTGLIAPSLAGVLLVVLGGTKAIPLLFFINGISFIISGISELFLVIPPLPEKPALKGIATLQQFGGMLKEGLVYVQQSQMLTRMFTIFAAINFFMVPLMQVVIPALIVDVYRLPEAWLGFIQSGIAAGFMVGSLALSILKAQKHSQVVLGGIWIIGATVGLIGVAAALPGMTPVTPVQAVIFITALASVLGLSAALANIKLATIMQIIVPNEMRGRVFSFLNTFASGLMPLALGISGLVAAAAPLFIQPITGGLAVLGAGAALNRIEELKKY